MRTTRNGRNRYAIITDHHGKRQNIHLGPMRSGECKQAYRHIKALVRSHTKGVPISDVTQEWLDYTERYVRQRLAQIGLIHVDEID